MQTPTGHGDAPSDDYSLVDPLRLPSSLEDEPTASENQQWPVLDPHYQHGDRSILLTLLSKKPDLEYQFDSLLQLLSSPKHNEVISAEVAEIIGYDDIELAMEILNRRSDATQELLDFLAGARRSREFIDDKKKTGRQLNRQQISLGARDAQTRMEQQFRENAARPLFSGLAQPAPEVLPHIYTISRTVQGTALSHLGSKYLLPPDTTRHQYDDYDEVIVPPSKPVPPRETERYIRISELDPLARGSFPGYTSLNRIQSIVYPTAYKSNENMLVCAPTGAGKTDVAMLTILRILSQNQDTTSGNSSVPMINKDAFKIIYVAPMKALASEIVRKLGKRLRWLSIRVRELTGDMQLTKAEIAETQIIVTTPEKWDVVTRKPTGEGDIASSLKLLIIDEVHLLNEERGAVIETIVARTLRQVEFSQSIIRIVGLSATLPNYVDVADFLKVSRYKGLFYFDSSFRPIPLEQHFIGIKGKPGSPQSRRNMDRVTYQKLADIVNRGHQAMVFVHARKETVKTALSLVEAATADGTLEEFSCGDHEQYTLYRREIGESKNQELKQLFDHGFGIHHAGMLRSDRNMVEKMFQARAIKVLCCTATLAWGVNLPAHAVIIKGTQVYDSTKGAFSQLSVLDVLQVFGRAGRPGLESRGEGYLCTTEDMLDHYLNEVTSQHPIESKFLAGMVDALNAEISLGSVLNTRDAIQWLGYTYWFVRIRKNPRLYGLSHDAQIEDPNFGNKRSELVTLAARQLQAADMIKFDEKTSALAITDLGRIAAKYYIRYSSVQIFSQEFRSKMTEADVLGMLSLSSEFEQLQVRESEIKELERLAEVIPCSVKGGTDTSQGKVNILLQGYISRRTIVDFALVSDTAYVAQNGGRIARALLEIAISRKWANVSAVLMGLCKAIEKRIWPFENPMRQFDLKDEVLYSLERWADELSVAELASYDDEDLGKLVHLNKLHGKAILKAVKQFPTMHIKYDLRPLSSDVLKLSVQLTSAFTWNTKRHGTAETFWLWVEDHDETTILQIWHLALHQNADFLNVTFVISISESQPPPLVIIKFVSDRWVGAEQEVKVPLEHLVMPSKSSSHSPLLDLPFLSLSCLRDPAVEALFVGRLSHFNAIQTQIIWSLVHTRMNSLICAPAGCGKSLVGQLVVWTTINTAGAAEWVLVIVPRRSDATKMMSDFLSQRMRDVKIELATSSNCLSSPQTRTIRLATAAQLFDAILQWDPSHEHSLDTLKLILCEQLEQLDSSYEMGISFLRYATRKLRIRFVGLSASLTDPADIASWLGAELLHSFRPQDRDQALNVSTHAFSIPHSAAFFKAMAKPVHAVIQTTPLGESAIIFVPSRGLCRSIALDLITQCALETESGKGYLPSSFAENELERRLLGLRDRSLVDFLSRGVGLFYDGLQKSDQQLILGMFMEGIVKVLLVPRESCWTLPVRAAVVVTMGTQYVDVRPQGSERNVCDYPLTEIVHMQSRAVRHASTGHFALFCQSEAKDTIHRFLSEGLPLESSLLESSALGQGYQRWKKSGLVANKGQGVELLAYTFLAKRVVTNPCYYDTTSGRDETLSRIVDRMDEAENQQ